jgi:hypothetical protein
MLSKDWFELKYTLDTQQETVNITIDSACESYCVLLLYIYVCSLSLSLYLTNTHADKVGCSNYTHPINGSQDQDSLTCEPVPVNSEDFKGNVTTEWRQFSTLEELQDFFRNCSDSPEDCTNYNHSGEYRIKNSELFTLMNNNETLIFDDPARTRGWYVPSFTVNDNLTYVAPYTFLYRK